MTGAPGALALRRDADGGEAPALRPARRAHLTRPSTHRRLIVIARDDTALGILHSRFHEAWSLWLGKGNDLRYTPTTTFETFPFLEGLSPLAPADEYADDRRVVAVAEAARRLEAFRGHWLNPPERDYGMLCHFRFSLDRVDSVRRLRDTPPFPVNVRTGMHRRPGLLSGGTPLSPAAHAARSTSNAARLRASLLNSMAMRWIGWPRCRYLSA